MTPMIPTQLVTSARLALFGGILLPVLETVRRWQQMGDWEYFTYWVDDYLIGGFLVYAALKTRRDPVSGQLYLCAAWGAATVMMVLSFIGQLQRIGMPDPAPVPASVVILIKGVLLAGAVYGLRLSLARTK